MLLPLSKLITVKFKLQDQMLVNVAYQEIWFQFANELTHITNIPPSYQL